MRTDQAFCSTIGTGKAGRRTRVKGRDGLLFPDFIGLGPPRTGTTWLHNALEDVVVLPRGTKETQFFAGRYRKGFQWYASHFRHAERDLPIGEFDPNFFRKDAIDRIARLLPDCRLICTMRDPVERAYSLYKHLSRMGRTRGSFEEWLPGLEDGNQYAKFVGLWRQRFGAERLLVTFFDDLEADSQSYLNIITDFIGAARVDLRQKVFRDGARNQVKSAPRNRELARRMSRFRRALQNRRAYTLTRILDRARVWGYFFEGGEPYQALPAEIEREARERFRPETEALEDLLGRDLSAWKCRADFVHSGLD